jgi:uncharacterized membrane protein (UPF0127 family)
MTRNLCSLFLCGFLLVLPACHPASDALPASEILFGNQPLRLEVALTPAHAQRGLMFRKALPENEGMLFPFDSPRQAVFWMRNTTLPLSIAFLDADGRVLEIRKLEPLDETRVVSQSDRVSYALEVNRGWFDRHQIQAGSLITWKTGWRPSQEKKATTP